MSAVRDAGRPRQLPLELGHVPAFSREDLVVSPVNAAAVGLLERWPDWPAAVTVLAGPTGSGKTHIAHVWASETGATELRSSSLAGAAIEAAGRGPVLIDNVDAGSIDEAGMFHLINAVRQQGSHLLLCARQFPATWGVALPDLASRLKAAATVEIGEPDDLLLAGVMTKLFADRQVEVEPHVVQFVVRRMERSLSSALDIVAALDNAALESKTRISRALAADVLAKYEGLPPGD